MDKIRLFAQLGEKKVKCLACQRYCQIEEDQVGFCRTRLNRKGELYSLIYGRLSGVQIDPIEKKPLYHFYPGTEVLSIGSYGCNYRCKQCLNYHCSWGESAARILKKFKDSEISNFQLPISNKASPQQVVDLALRKKCLGIAFTYNEPSIWPEYIYDTASLARKKGLKTVYVTNGSWTRESLRQLAPVIDACNIDIKGYYDQTYQKMGAYFGQVLEMAALVVKKYRIFTELTTLIIPTINDSTSELKAIASWIKKNLGAEIPWHLSRYDPKLAPDKEFRRLPATPKETLSQAHMIGRQAGLKHVYIWAPPKDFREKLFAVGDSFCPDCGRKLVRRQGWQPEVIGLKKRDNQVICAGCGRKVNFRI